MWTDKTIDEVISLDPKWDYKKEKMFELGQRFRGELEDYKSKIEKYVDISFLQDDWEVMRELLKSYLYRAHGVKVTAFIETEDENVIKNYFDLGQVREKEIYIFLDAIPSDEKICEVLVSGIASLQLSEVGCMWKKDSKNFSIINYAYTIEKAEDILKFYFIEGFFGNKSNIPSLSDSLNFDQA